MSNDDLFNAINGLARHTPWLNKPAEAIAGGGGIAMLLMLLVIAWWGARRHGAAVMAAALWAPLGTALATAVTHPIASVLAEPLPPQSPGVFVLLHRGSAASSPSLHATLAGAAVVGLFLVRRRLAVAGAVVALLMGFSRVYVGLHYPSDALAGFVLGAVLSGLGFVLVKSPLVALVFRLRTSPLRPLVAG